MTDLTPEQKELLVKFRLEKWKQGTSCEPADRKAAEEAIIEAYAEIRLPKPEFIWAESPYGCEIILHEKEPQNNGKLPNKPVLTQFWGQMDTYWQAHHRFGIMIGHKQKADLIRRLSIAERISAACGWWYPRENFCVVCDRFEEIHWDNARNSSGLPFRLHHLEGKAIKFRDGWGVYSWHGLRIPGQLIEERLTIKPETLLKIDNVEFRRCAIEIYSQTHGPAKFLKDLKAVEIGTDKAQRRQRKLYRVGDQNFLHVVNGSLEPDGTRREFLIGADPNMTTPHDAVASSYGRPAKIYKEAVRT